MDKLTIRYALPSDAENICHVHHSAVQALRKGLYEEKILDAWIAAITPVNIRDGMNLTNSIWFIAEAGSKTVGFVALESEKIRSLYVHPECQSKGIGSRLLESLESEAAIKNINKIFLNSSLNACKFYESHGYAMIKKIVFKLNETVGMECFEMAKDISLYSQPEQ